MGIPTKFPTLVGIIFLILIVGSIVYLTERVFRIPSVASGSQKPENIRVANVTDASFTVSWTTQLPATGTLLVSSTERNNRLYYDERDVSGKSLGTYINHSIGVRDAKPNTTYSIKFLSNGRQYDEGTSVQTPTSLPPNTSGLEPAYGTITMVDGTPAEGALVYLTLEGGQELSAITKSSGLWLIPLNQVRTADMTSFLPTYERMTETILVRHNNEEASATTDTLNDSPVPQMSPGKVYDFRRQQAKTSNSTLAIRPAGQAADSSPLPVGGSVLGNAAARSFPVTLANPAQGAALATTLPLIQGTGVPDKFVGVSLGITNPTSGSTKIRADGVWTYTPPKPLAPGKQSVTISTTDQTGKPVAITHTFEILKSGTQVLGDATPSATLTASPTETPVEVPTSTLAGEPVPTSGNELPTILLLLIGIALLGSGAVVFIK